MIIKRCLFIGLSLLVALLGVLAACAGPTSTPTSTPTGTQTPTPTETGPLAQIIAGAIKEGTVSVNLRTGYSPKSMERLRKEIKERFGADLDIKFTPAYSMPKILSDAIMEYKAGATPTFEVLTFSTQVVEGNKAGILEQVDWKPLITSDTNPGVVMGHPALHGAIVTYTGYAGLMYNPDKVLAAQLPQTLNDLANPKWQGKVGVANYASTWARWSYILGKEKVFADLRAILKNKSTQGAYVDLQNRYLLGEIWLAFISTVYLKEALDKGMPAAWQFLDFAEIQSFSLVVRKGAPHPNAAKLVAIYLASPAGAKFTLEESGAGNLYYPGNYEHDLKLQAQRQGVPEYELATYPGLLEFYLTDEFIQWQSEVQLIQKTGG